MPLDDLFLAGFQVQLAAPSIVRQVDSQRIKINNNQSNPESVPLLLSTGGITSHENILLAEFTHDHTKTTRMPPIINTGSNNLGYQNVAAY